MQPSATPRACRRCSSRLHQRSARVYIISTYAPAAARSESSFSATRRCRLPLGLRVVLVLRLGDFRLLLDDLLLACFCLCSTVTGVAIFMMSARGSSSALLSLPLLHSSRGEETTADARRMWRVLCLRSSRLPSPLPPSLSLPPLLLLLLLLLSLLLPLLLLVALLPLRVLLLGARDPSLRALRRFRLPLPLPLLLLLLLSLSLSLSLLLLLSLSLKPARLGPLLPRARSLCFCRFGGRRDVDESFLVLSLLLLLSPRRLRDRSRLLPLPPFPLGATKSKRKALWRRRGMRLVKKARPSPPYMSDRRRRQHCTRRSSSRRAEERVETAGVEWPHAHRQTRRILSRGLSRQHLVLAARYHATQQQEVLLREPPAPPQPPWHGQNK
jgi:hypothetical protein